MAASGAPSALIEQGELRLTVLLLGARSPFTRLSLSYCSVLVLHLPGSHCPIARCSFSIYQALTVLLLGARSPFTRLSPSYCSVLVLHLPGSHRPIARCSFSIYQALTVLLLGARSPFTRLRLSGANSLFISLVLHLSVVSNLPRKPFF